MTRLMTPDELRAIQEELGLTGKEMSVTLGCSHVGYKRFVTGERPIPIYIARLAVAVGILHRRALMEDFLKAVKKYVKAQVEKAS